MMSRCARESRAFCFLAKRRARRGRDQVLTRSSPSCGTLSGMAGGKMLS